MKLIFPLLLSFSIITNAQTNTNFSLEMQETAILKAQLQVMQSDDQRLTTSVYWSLGVVGAIALLLVGYSWFTNMRIYERDKAALTQELEGKLETKFSNFKTALEKDNLDLNKHISEKMTKPISDLEKQFEEKLQAIKTSSEADRSQLQKNLSSLENWVEFNRLLSEARYWESKEVAAKQTAQRVQRFLFAFRR
jgi:hypothetical protein